MSVKEIFEIIEDILRYLENDESNDYETNQGIIGLQHLFRGYAVKVWTDLDFNFSRFNRLNKILIKYCVVYYVKCWKYRNKCYYDKDKQRERVIKQYENMQKYIEDKEPQQIKLFAQRTKLEVERCRTKKITRQIYNVKGMIKKVEKLPQNDIQRYFIN